MTVLKGLLQLSMETANNRIEISKINSDMISLEKQISDVAEGIKDVVTKSELADMMNSFISDDDEKWLMFNTQFSSADEVYESTYRQSYQYMWLTITLDYGIAKYNSVIAGLLKHSPLVLLKSLLKSKKAGGLLHPLLLTDCFNWTI